MIIGIRTMISLVRRRDLIHQCPNMRKDFDLDLDLQTSLFACFRETFFQ